MGEKVSSMYVFFSGLTVRGRTSDGCWPVSWPGRRKANSESPALVTSSTTRSSYPERFSTERLWGTEVPTYTALANSAPQPSEARSVKMNGFCRTLGSPPQLNAARMARPEGRRMARVLVQAMVLVAFCGCLDEKG